MIDNGVDELADMQDVFVDDKSSTNNDDNAYVLYLIVDKPIDGMLEYFRNYGIKVSRIFSNIKDARDTLLMQIEPTKVVVIDAGTGRFANMAARKDLIDLMGISDEDNKTTVFYSDLIIKSEVEYSPEVQSKSMEWVRYQSTAHVVAHLLQNKKKIKFIEDGEYADASPIVENLKIKGFKNKVPAEPVKLGAVQINTSDIISRGRATDDGYSLLQEYKIEL